jgi:1-acyl-sn-glycerol-3-phosphate acyltransferase/nucleoside-diphosphate-sugar epimerase
MSNVVVIGPDPALTELLASRLGTARTARDAEDLGELAAGADAVVAVPGELRGEPLVDAAACLAEKLRGVPHAVLVSSAAVNEPNAHHPGMVSEERLPALRKGNAVARRWRELEAAFGGALEGSPTVLTVLRPAALVVPGGRGWWSRLLAGRVAFTPLGFDPTVQLLSPEELADAVAWALEHPRPETYNVAPAGGVPLAKALKAAGTWRVPVPFAVQWLARKALRPLGAAPADQLDYLRYSWTVSDAKIREAGFRPSSSSSSPPLHDPFGFDPDYVRRLGKYFFRFLHDAYWRIEVRGLEHVPRSGPAVLTGMHRGFQPWDGVMAMYLLTRELGRTPRFLVHPTLVKFPFLAPYMIKCGGLHACNENAAWVLERGELLAIFPEGIRGAFRRYRDVYKLGRFGRDEYVKMALRHRSPIVPFVTVGSAEIYPIFGKISWGWWKRYTEWPCFPITPTMGTVPLPSKWHTRFLEPLDVQLRHPPEAANDVATVRAISREVRARMRSALDDMLRRRKSIFFGSIFEESAA